MTALLAVEAIVKSFGGRRVLSSASVRAHAGQLRALLGRNGTGKSTLFKIAAGWLAPDNGSVIFAGRGYLSARHAELAADGLFFLPDHDALSTAFTVRRQLEMLHRQFRGLAVAEAAERVGITAQLDKHIPALSGGELRRAELAAVLVRMPRCLLADEPYRGIMPKDAEALTRTLRELAAGGMAIVVTGHEVRTLLDAADHVTWCTEGTTHELGPPADAVRHDGFRRSYLGPWYR